MEKVREILPLEDINGRCFYYSYIALKELVNELEIFLNGEDYLNSKIFAKSVMFTHEVKANNNVEGIKDEVGLIEKVIENAKSINDKEIRNRIINLYRGYKYIISGKKDINEDNVSSLYQILSKDLLCSSDLNRMGELYRTAPVYILQHGRLDDSIREGIPENRVREFMNIFFDFVNDKQVIDSPTNYFIKSQIMHFYFVYIHPYFDMNGRTSRTVAMWYLLNNDIYPYIIFNRGINYDSRYDGLIGKTEDTHDLSSFLKYMLLNVKKELEKQYVMNGLADASSRRWKASDYQSLEYFISMNEREKTVLDFVKAFNRFNDKKKVKEVFESMILPLIDDGILLVDRSTNKCMFDEQPNLVLSLNRDKLSNIDLSKVNRIKV